MGMSNPQDELVDEVVELRAKVKAYEDTINSLTDSLEALEQEYDDARQETEAYQDEASYAEQQQYEAESAIEDLKSAVEEQLELLLGVPTRDLVESVNILIRAIRNDELV